MKGIKINPKYIKYQQFVENVPTEFTQSGEIIYDARNQIRVFTLPDGQKVNVKRYHKPFFLNRIIYTFIRKPKALRAYQYAFKLLEMGIPTPEPIACITEMKCGLLSYSYLITIQSPLRRNFYEFREHSVQGYEDVVTDFARFVADVHKKGVLHRDFSPGNILFDVVDGKSYFSLVDINRMSFGKELGLNASCKNFMRLWGNRDYFELLAKKYAEARGWDVEKCTQKIIHYWQKFWRNRK